MTVIIRARQLARCLVVLSCVCAGLAPARVDAQGAVSGPQVLPFAGTALDINERGDIVGYDPAYHAFLWTTDTGRLALGTLPGLPLCEASGVNNRRQVVGWCWGDGGPLSRAFLWTQAGGMQDLGPGLALAINDAGDVAGGGAVDVTGLQQAWRWINGHRLLLGLAGTESAATAINEAGHLAVSGPSPQALHIYRWTPGQGLVDTGITGYGLGINDHDAIVSSAAWSWNPFMVRGDNTVVEVPMPAGWIGSANDIDDAGLVAGTASDVVTEQSFAFVWREDGVLVQLGGAGSAATAVNQLGDVVGAVTGDDGQLHPAIWTVSLPAAARRAAVAAVLGAQIDRGLVRRGPAEGLLRQLEGFAGERGGHGLRGHLHGMLTSGHLPAWDAWFLRALEGAAGVPTVR